MNLRVWLHRLLEVEGNVGLGLLHNLFRSLRDLGPPLKKQPQVHGQEIFEELTFRDDYRIRLGATSELVTSVPYRELIAPISEMTRNTAADEMESAMQRLTRIHQGGPVQFPMDVYWQAIGLGLRQADEWLHYGNGSRQAALAFFLPAAEALQEKPEDVFSFSLHCAVITPFPVRQLLPDGSPAASMFLPWSQLKLNALP